MTLDVNAAEFWNPTKVDAELRRIYDICAGCRRCLPLCPSFKVLFDRLDVEAVDGDVEKLPAADAREVVDLCYQCKLCFNHCPYTPPHRWAVDFPRLMLRARASDARARGVSVQDRMLGNTELVGKLGSLTAPISNWMNEFSAHRALLQFVAGIHKDRNLPKFHRETFSKWFSKRQRNGTAPAGAGAPGVLDDFGRRETPDGDSGQAMRRGPGGGGPSPRRAVALFSTCTVESNDPAIGKAAVAAREKNGVD